ncbi:MAG: hypothetical protein IKD15_01130 [Clostridia bacterium]|nr:hypothetical protein [Clostridia bacterium]
MKIRFMGQGKLEDLQSKVEGDEDLTLLSFGCMGEVSYEKELRGESDFFEKATRLSKQTQGVVVCGCITDTRGMKRKSALLAENGRLMGVSDMTHTFDGGISCGAGLRVYDTKVGKVGIAVGEDITVPKVVEALSACGSDVIVCPYGKVLNSTPQILLRAYAYLYGIPLVLCGMGYCLAVGAEGEIQFASAQNLATYVLEMRKEYHLMEERRRGVLCF